MTRDILRLGLLVLVCIFSFQSAHAGILLEASGKSSTGVDVSFKAELTISGDLLTIVLTNNSPVNTLDPSGALGSFYFDILNSSHQRPTLTYTSARADLYLTSKTNPDTLYQANADLMTLPDGKGWMFRAMDAAFSPNLGFGIGTIGNSNLSPNNFPGMKGIESAIYRGEITTQNLTDKLLIKDTATFTLNGLTGFTEADISSKFAFGLGTAPDSLLTPEPLTLAILSMGGLFMTKLKR